MMPAPGRHEPAKAGSLFSSCQKALIRLDSVSKGVVILAIGVMTCLVIVQVFCRYALSYSIDWADEMSRLAFVWTIFLALPHGVRFGIHVGIDVVVNKFSARLQDLMFRLSALLGAVLMIVVFHFGLQVTQDGWAELMPTINVTSAVYYIAVLIAAGHSLLHLLLLAWGGAKTWASIDGQNEVSA
jgi:TRAP-type C4-dicarboxylate transport system permease small subunit